MLAANIKEFIFSDLDKNYNFIHVTDVHSALSIAEHGFYFQNPLYKTADLVIDNSDWLDFWWQQRKFYGNQIIVLGISKSLFEKCSAICKSEFDGKINSFQLLNANKLRHYIDGEAQLKLSRNFIKGYIDLTENIVYPNDQFNPDLNSQIELNLKKYKEFILEK